MSQLLDQMRDRIRTLHYSIRVWLSDLVFRGLGVFGVWVSVSSGSGCQTWFLVPGSIRAMICWSSSASWGRARTGHHVIDDALKLDAKSSGHFPSRAH